MHAKVQKWGNSLGVRIPTSFSKDIHIQEGSDVDLVLEKGTIVIKPNHQKSLDDLLKMVTQENLHSEFDTGSVVGKEQW